MKKRAGTLTAMEEHEHWDQPPRITSGGIENIVNPETCVTEGTAAFRCIPMRHVLWGEEARWYCEENRKPIKNFVTYREWIIEMRCGRGERLTMTERKAHFGESPNIVELVQRHLNGARRYLAHAQVTGEGNWTRLTGDLYAQKTD